MDRQKSRPSENSLADFCTSALLRAWPSAFLGQMRLIFGSIKSGEVQKSARKFLPGLDISLACLATHNNCTCKPNGWTINRVFKLNFTYIFDNYFDGMCLLKRCFACKVSRIIRSSVINWESVFQRWVSTRCACPTLKKENSLGQNLHWKLGQQTPSIGALLAYLETKT